VEKDPYQAKKLVRQGIPQEIRGEAWYEPVVLLVYTIRKVISGGQELAEKNPGVYEV
jgi:hypothetical protein